MDRWFLMKDGRRLGPLGLDALVEQLDLLPVPQDAMVWKEGLAAWQEVRSLPELASKLPPPSPPRPATLPPGPAARGGHAAKVGALAAEHDQQRRQPPAPRIIQGSSSAWSWILLTLSAVMVGASQRPDALVPWAKAVIFLAILWVMVSTAVRWFVPGWAKRRFLWFSVVVFLLTLVLSLVPVRDNEPSRRATGPGPGDVRAVTTAAVQAAMAGIDRWNHAVEQLPPIGGVTSYESNRIAAREIAELRAAYAEIHAAAITLRDPKVRVQMDAVDRNYQSRLDAITALYAAVARGDMAATDAASRALRSADAEGLQLASSFIDEAGQ